MHKDFLNYHRQHHANSSRRVAIVEHWQLARKVVMVVRWSKELRRLILMSALVFSIYYVWDILYI
jgi:hypothetical protein